MFMHIILQRDYVYIFSIGEKVARKKKLYWSVYGESINYSEISLY